MILYIFYIKLLLIWLTPFLLFAVPFDSLFSTYSDPIFFITYQYQKFKSLPPPQTFRIKHMIQMLQHHIILDFMIYAAAI